MPDTDERELLWGWGRATRSAATVHRVADEVAVAKVIESAGARGAIARGLGRSYGDAALLAGGDVVELDAPDLRDLGGRPVTVTVGGGVPLSALLATLVPKGAMPAVLPGTAHVTVGGAIAADVHGKNHHVDGSFASHVESFRIVTPIGVRDVSKTEENDLFMATVGGMGLTGVITQAVIRLKAIESAYVSVDTDRSPGIDELMDAMSQNDDDYVYSVAWLDCASPALGRGVLTRANPASASEAPTDDPLRYRDSRPPGIPDVVPSGALKPIFVRAFNEAMYRKAPRRERGRPAHLSSFFHPLDVIGDWNRVYGRRGFLQYQFVVPFGAESVIRKVLESQRSHGLPSYLAVLKRMGPGSGGFLSFPISGWTLALDFPVGDDDLGPMLRDWDELVLAAGGRIYLAKDSRAMPATVSAMYPDLDRFREVKGRIDPDSVLRSDLSNRLQLA